MKSLPRKLLSKLMMVLVSFFLLITPAGRCYAGSSCDFFDPITDVCWWCMFPIRIGGVKVSLGFNNVDYADVNSPVCVCMTPLPRIGITVSFWEAVRLAETVKSPWKFPDLCLDLSIAKVPTGSTTSSGINAQEKQSWQVHWIMYPIMEALDVATDFACLDHSGYDLAYASELDPAWNDDFTSVFVYPETILFANPIAEFACIPDRILTSAKRFGLEPLFWCAGNWGTTYPFESQTECDNPTISAALAVAKVNAMLHRNLVAKKTIGGAALCGIGYSFIFPKKEYKYQLAKPIRGGSCFPVGEDSVWWTEGKERLTDDTYHTFVIWRKRDCCAF